MFVGSITLNKKGRVTLKGRLGKKMTEKGG